MKTYRSLTAGALATLAMSLALNAAAAQAQEEDHPQMQRGNNAERVERVPDEPRQNAGWAAQREARAEARVEARAAARSDGGERPAMSARQAREPAMQARAWRWPDPSRLRV